MNLIVKCYRQCKENPILVFTIYVLVN